MLTRKQKWRRVQHHRGKAALKCGAVEAVVNDRGPKAINSLSVGDSLLHLLGAKKFGAVTREEPRATEVIPSNFRRGDGGGGGVAAAKGSTPRRVFRIRRVSFNQQVRVVLVPSRPELESIKADLWWAGDDYFNFRRDYILAVKAAGHHHDLDIAAPAAPPSSSLPSSDVKPDIEATKPGSEEVTTAGAPRTNACLLPCPPSASSSFPQYPPETNVTHSGEISTSDAPEESDQLLPRPPSASPSFPSQLPPETNAAYSEEVTAADVPRERGQLQPPPPSASPSFPPQLSTETNAAHSGTPERLAILCPATLYGDERGAVREGHHESGQLQPPPPNASPSFPPQPSTETNAAHSGEVTTADAPRESGQLQPPPPSAPPSFPLQLTPEMNAAHSGRVTAADVPRESDQLLPRPPSASSSFPPQLPYEMNAPPPPQGRQQETELPTEAVRQAPIAKGDLDVTPAVLAASAPCGGGEAAASVASVPVSSFTQKQQQCHRMGANATVIPAADARGVALTAAAGVPPIRVRQEEREVKVEVERKQAMPLRRPSLPPLASRSPSPAMASGSGARSLSRRGIEVGVVAAKAATTTLASSVYDAHGSDRSFSTQSLSTNSEFTDPESFSGSDSDGDDSPCCHGCLKGSLGEGQDKRSAKWEIG